ncbi:hypothetical protein C4577_05160 [Candidatus Parcubacteria bacterium]|nr:MAG: hypothetical protein C4577_05160 [Candidatus Parcubacteria bacterium]
MLDSMGPLRSWYFYSHDIPQETKEKIWKWLDGFTIEELSMLDVIVEDIRNEETEFTNRAFCELMEEHRVELHAVMEATKMLKEMK